MPMIEGITVLSSEPDFSFAKAVVFALVITIIAVFLAIMFISKELEWIGVLLFALILTTGAVVGGETDILNTGKARYTVTIDDDVNLIEFNEKYEIISQDDKLWEIRER